MSFLLDCLATAGKCFIGFGEIMLTAIIVGILADECSRRRRR